MTPPQQIRGDIGHRCDTTHTTHTQHKCSYSLGWAGLYRSNIKIREVVQPVCSLQGWAGLGWAGLAGLAGRVTAGAHQGYNTRVAVAGLGPGCQDSVVTLPTSHRTPRPRTLTHGDTRTMEAAVRGHGVHATADILTGRREDLFSPQVVRPRVTCPCNQTCAR